MPLTVASSIVCEDVRKEADGKLSLLGVHPARRILLDSDVGLPTRIAAVHFFLLIDSQVDSRLPIKFVARPPSGTADVYPTLDAGEIEVFAGKENALHIVLKDFPAAEYGKYEVRLELPDQILSLDFEIQLRA